MFYTDQLFSLAGCAVECAVSSVIELVYRRSVEHTSSYVQVCIQGKDIK
jgi:hypothetical protein